MERKCRWGDHIAASFLIFDLVGLGSTGSSGLIVPVSMSSFSPFGPTRSSLSRSLFLFCLTILLLAYHDFIADVANTVLTATACKTRIPGYALESHQDWHRVPPLHPICPLFCRFWSPLDDFGSVCLFQDDSGVGTMNYRIVRSLWNQALADLPIVILRLLIQHSNGRYAAFFHGQ